MVRAGDDRVIWPTSRVRSNAPDPVTRVEEVPSVTPVAETETPTLSAAPVSTAALWSRAVATREVGVVEGAEAPDPPAQAVPTSTRVPTPTPTVHCRARR